MDDLLRHMGQTPVQGDTTTSQGYKTAIITGCSSGIGLATTILFLQKSYRVLGVDIQEFDEDVMKDVVIEDANEDDDGDRAGKKKIIAWKDRFRFLQANLMDQGACDMIVGRCVDVWGPKVSVLANIAGIIDNFSSADTLKDDDWDRVIGINLTAPVKMMRAVLPLMRKAKYGSIINMSSKAGTSGACSGVAYTASKHGLIGAMRNVAWRFNHEGIRCNAISPGGVMTNILKSVSEEAYDNDALRVMNPVLLTHMQGPSGEQMPLIEASDVAKAVLFLASDDARMINGVCLPVDRAFGVI